MKRYIRMGAIFVLIFSSLSFATSALALEAHNNIKGLFNTTRDVVVKCLECHKEKASEVLKSTHWTWKRLRTVNGKQQMYGKMDSLAGFAIDIASNPTRCLQCHISSAPDTVLFEKSGEAEVDCLVCHDTTGKYNHYSDRKRLEQSDFETIAHHVGKPEPKNCAICHFALCGLNEHAGGTAGDNRITPADDDVHMNGMAASFSCQTCHVKTSGHSFSRRMIQENMSDDDGCASCHTGAPHRLAVLNRHNSAVACQTCHIPHYAAKKPAVISWNWFLNGKTNPLTQSISDTNSSLLDKSGFTSSKMIRPVYMWDDGADLVYSRGQRIQPDEMTYLLRPAEKTPSSKIAPFKVMYGTQLYDAKYRYLISPLLNSTNGNIFPDTDWDTIARDGMKAIVLPYSGEYGVAVTAAYRRINHGVAPVGDALGCTDCHGNGGRLNWQELGYGKDPWPGDKTDQAAAAESREENVVTRKGGKTGQPQELQVLPFPGS